jgi:uncharacterized protein Usg
MILIQSKVIVTVDVLYWLPDYNDLLQQFIWQTNDTRPNYPRVHGFLNYWKDNVEAVIAEVQIADAPVTEYNTKRII